MLLLVIFPIFSVGQWMIYPLETRFSKPINMDSVDAIIVMAGGLNRKQSASKNICSLMTNLKGI